MIQVSVNTTLPDLMEYLNSLLKSTNMKCLTPDKALSGECGFMAANLYAKVEKLFCWVRANAFITAKF